MKGIIRDLEVRNRHFVVIQNDDGFYLAIEDKYLDERGRLTKTLNGGQMCASKDLKTCLTSVRDRVEIDYLLDMGATKAEAFSIVAGVPLEVAEILF